MTGIFLAKSARWFAVCSVFLLIIAAMVQGVALSASTIPKNIAAMFDDDEIDYPSAVRASSTRATAPKGQGQGARKSAKPRLLVSAAASELRNSSVKHNHAKSGKEKLFSR